MNVKCSQCGKEFPQPEKQSKSGNYFCSRTCGSKHTNANKTTGNHRSFLERWLANKLRDFYPQLEFHYNRTDAIRKELDIYIPKLKLAFELNGVFHYQPVYGTLKFANIQRHDAMKHRLCQNQGIELHCINTSSQHDFNEKSSMPFLIEISKIIDAKVQSQFLP